MEEQNQIARKKTNYDFWAGMLIPLSVLLFPFSAANNPPIIGFVLCIIMLFKFKKLSLKGRIMLTVAFLANVFFLIVYLVAWAFSGWKE